MGEILIPSPSHGQRVGCDSQTTRPEEVRLDYREASSGVLDNGQFRRAAKVSGSDAFDLLHGGGDGGQMLRLINSVHERWLEASGLFGQVPLFVRGAWQV